MENKVNQISDEEAEQVAFWGGSDRIRKTEQKNWQDLSGREVDRQTNEGLRIRKQKEYQRASREGL